MCEERKVPSVPCRETVLTRRPAAFQCCLPSVGCWNGALGDQRVLGACFGYQVARSDGEISTTGCSLLVPGVVVEVSLHHPALQAGALQAWLLGRETSAPQENSPALALSPGQAFCRCRSDASRGGVAVAGADGAVVISLVSIQVLKQLEITEETKAKSEKIP